MWSIQETTIEAKVNTWRHSNKSSNFYFNTEHNPCNLSWTIGYDIQREKVKVSFNESRIAL